MIDAARKQQYRLVQEHKAPRRMALADDLSLLWESETTIDHQVAEMLWMEDEPESRAAIKQGYAELMPRPGRPTATLSIEVQDHGAIKPRLRHWAGIERCIRLRLAGADVPAVVLGDAGDDEAATAVTYLAFDLPDGTGLDGAQVVVDHAALQGTFPVPDAVASAPL